MKAGSNLKLLSADLKFSSFVAINCRKCPVSDTLSKNLEQFDKKLEEATKKHLDTFNAALEEKFNELATITASLNDAPEITKINDAIESVGQKLSSFNENLAAIEAKEGEDGPVTAVPWSVVVGRNKRTGKAAPHADFEGIVANALIKNKEREMCDRSIVIIGLQEPKAEDGNPMSDRDMEKEDATTIRTVLRDMGLRHIEPENNYRLPRGKFADKVRPRKVKLILSDHHHQKIILEEKRLLKGNVDWNDVFFIPSRPLEERMVESTIRAQARVMNENIHGSNWRQCLDTAIEMIQYRDGKLWLAKRHNSDQNWKRVSVIPEAELPPLPTRQTRSTPRPRKVAIQAPLTPQAPVAPQAQATPQIPVGPLQENE